MKGFEFARVRRAQERGILVHGHEPLDTDMTPSLEGEARSYRS